MIWRWRLILCFYCSPKISRLWADFSEIENLNWRPFDFSWEICVRKSSSQPRPEVRLDDARVEARRPLWLFKLHLQCTKKLPPFTLCLCKCECRVFKKNLHKTLDSPNNSSSIISTDAKTHLLLTFSTIWASDYSKQKHKKSLKTPQRNHHENWLLRHKRSRGRDRGEER